MRNNESKTSKHAVLFFILFRISNSPFRIKVLYKTTSEILSRVFELNQKAKKHFLAKTQSSQRKA